VRGLESHPDFVVPGHLLVVLIVSDEEDCSIRDNALFGTVEWMSGSTEDLNIACNLPRENEVYLYPVDGEDARMIANASGLAVEGLDTYRDKLVSLKGGDAEAVIFAAIVGVPPGDASPCQGDGTHLKEMSCLDAPEMELRVGRFTFEGREYKHFEPACTRTDEAGVEETTARPGRRFVKTAMEFGENGYVYSICNESWDPAMRAIAEMIARRM
jgi:hypothetical protein